MNVGELPLPLLLDSQFEVFVDHEKVQTNKPDDHLIEGRFHKLPRLEESTDKEIVTVTMKTDLNENNCFWKHMAKNICERVKKDCKRGAPINDKMAELSIDELTELTIYDAVSA